MCIRDSVGADPKHRASTLEGQVARVADIIAYVNHDIDDAIRGGLLTAAELPASAIRVLGDSSSERIGRMVTDVVLKTLEGGSVEVLMGDRILKSTLALRTFLFETVYEDSIATAEFKKTSGILTGLWEKVRENPSEFLDSVTIESEGVDIAARDFLAGMTDRYAVQLFEQLFVPKPWVECQGS